MKLDLRTCHVDERPRHVRNRPVNRWCFIPEIVWSNETRPIIGTFCTSAIFKVKIADILFK